jgi:nickel/cobalt transporter (NicO) family protein
MVGYQNASLYKIDHPCWVSLLATVGDRGWSYALEKTEPATVTAPGHVHHVDDAHARAHRRHDDHAPAEHSHHGHDHTLAHAHDHDDEGSALPWGHAHGPEPEQLAGPGGWRHGLSAIVAVGLRPCSGAILVLVFALAQGHGCVRWWPTFLG